MNESFAAIVGKWATRRRPEGSISSALSLRIPERAETGFTSQPERNDWLISGIFNQRSIYLLFGKEALRQFGEKLSIYFHRFLYFFLLLYYLSISEFFLFLSILNSLSIFESFICFYLFLYSLSIFIYFYIVYLFYLYFSLF